MSSRFVLRLLSLMVALCLAVPATALVVRLTVYFSAGFNSSGAPGSGIAADVGSTGLVGPPGVFSIVPGPGGGQLRIADGGLMHDAAFLAELKQTYKGGNLDIDFHLTCSQTGSGLVLRAEDDSNSGLIDLEFAGGGGIKVDGVFTGKSYKAGVAYDCDLQLKDSLMGASTWSLILKGDNGDVVTAQGNLQSDEPLRVEEVQLIRPAGGTPGEFFLDDLRVSSTTFLPSY